MPLPPTFLTLTVSENERHGKIDFQSEGNRPGFGREA